MTSHAGVTLSSFEHRRDYGDVAGRDRWTVRAVNGWVRDALAACLSGPADAGAVLDVGCGEQPFRPLIESHRRRYVGMDVDQNSARTVDILSTLEDAPPPAERYSLILCTEVLEHVADIDAAFAGLRRLAAPGSAVIVTVPFVFPLHMEPYDFRRLTLYGLERLASDHGFRVESSDRLGRLTDVLAMLLADASILPLSRSPFVKAKVVLLRGAVAALTRVLDSRALSSGVAINSNAYLSNGVVLRAQ
jgi:Methyltransferase domain